MARAASFKPTLLGNTSYSLWLKYLFKSSTRLIWVRFSTCFFSYSALPDKAICASLLKSVIPASRLKVSRSASVLPSSFEIMPMRSSINSAVFCAISFLSLFVLRLYISSNWLIKSCPRRKLEFFKETVTTEVVCEVGTITKFPQYPLATFMGQLMVAVICRAPWTEEAPSTGIESVAWKKEIVPRSVGRMAGNFSKCFWISLSSIFTFTSKLPCGCTTISTTMSFFSFSASCGVMFTCTGEVLYNSFEGMRSSSL